MSNLDNFEDFWLIADNHFSHNNILAYENRPFENLDEMDEALIDAWNSVIQPHDRVLFLGDFTFKGISYSFELFNRLNGKVEFIKGNHDKEKVLQKLLQEGLIEEIHHIGKWIKVGHRQFHFTHYPLDMGERHNLYNVHGHIHKQISRYANQYNVGVDSLFMTKYQEENNLPFGTPIKFSTLMNIINIEEEISNDRNVISGQQ